MTRTGKSRSVHVGGQQMPMFVPDSEWTRIKELPDLRRVKILALDRETKDNGLRIGRGPGWAIRDGKVLGSSVAWDGGAFYAPLSHPETDNFDADAWTRWERDHVAAGVRFVYCNGPYDIGWGRADLDLFPPPGNQIEDVGAMAVIIDENRTGHKPYSLDSLCEWQGIPGKDKTLLKEAAATYGYPDYMAHLDKFPARFVGPYAEADAVSTLALYHAFLPKLEAEGTLDAYRLEADLIPLIHEMRRRGVRVNLDKAEKYRDDLIASRDQILAELGRQAGGTITMENIRSPRWLSETFRTHAPRIVLPRTKPSKLHPNGQESFAKWMRGHEHWLPRLAARADQLDEAANKFLQGFIIDYASNGRLHANINQFRGEEGGTRSHRLSLSDPPLQQMPGDKQPEIRDMVRDVFEPEDGELWCSEDYSQQEMKLIVEFACKLKCTRSEDAMQKYLTDPKTDYHTMVAELTGLDRRHAKDVNFAKAFGAGVGKFAAMSNHTDEEAIEIMTQYDTEMPFVQQLYEKCDKLAAKRGYIRMMDGARAHFDDWEPSWLSGPERSRGWGEGWDMWPCRIEEARARQRGEGKHGERPSGIHPWADKRLRRANTRKAMNRLVQGSAARQTKKAMLLCWQAGIVPLIQMHDELNFSLDKESDGKKVSQMMRDAHPFRLPFVVDCEWGTSWGRARKVKETGYGATFAEAKKSSIKRRKKS